MSIKHITGDLLSSGCSIRVHQVNCRGVMGAGIARQVRAKYPEAFAAYSELCRLGGSKLLGQAQLVPCHDGTIICNLFGQDGFGSGKPQTNMPAIETALAELAKRVEKSGESVGFPKLMGAGLAGGNWADIYSLIEKYFGADGIDCTIVEWDGGRR